MKAQKISTISYRKAWIAFVASISCLVIYVLACVISPPAWSPDSSKIAILVTPPNDEPDKYAIFTYDITTDEHILLDEVKADGSLSAPSWSPDGKWIAYYKIEPTSETTMSTEPEVIEPNQPIGEDVASNESLQTAKPVVKSSNEENLILPSSILEIIEETMVQENKPDSYDIKLLIVTSDAKERRILQVMKWKNSYDDIREIFTFIRPVWSPDCKRLFYARMLEEIFCVGSIEIESGKTYAHIFDSIGTPIVSPDGNWIASYSEDNNTLISAKVDGSMCSYYKLNFEIESSNLLIIDGMFWSTDSKKIFITDIESSLHYVDIDSGQINLLTAHDPNITNAYYTLSSNGQELYYIPSHENDDTIALQENMELKYLNLMNGSKGTMFTFQLPELSENTGRFSISPNGKIVLLRSIIEEDGIDRPALIFLDGKTQKIVKTDRWLLKPLYSESDLTFDDKLIGRWNREDGQLVITKGSLPGTYKLTWSQDKKETNNFANLIKLKGITLLGVFFDESVLENRDASGSHLVPDMFLRIIQIDSKLRLQTVNYDKLEEILEKTEDIFKPEDFGTENMLEFEKVN